MLNGLTIVVTGAAQGVGKGLALAAGAAGAAVIVTARNRDSAEAVAAEIRDRGGQAHAVRCDVTDRRDVDAAVAAAISHFGRLDSMVHNATSRFSARGSKLQDITEENWDDQVAVALRGAFYCAQTAFPALRSARGSFIILISNAGIEGSLPLPVYSAVKGAQHAMVKSLAREWGPDGVRVNAVAPVAMTPAMGDFFAAQPEMRRYIETRSALQRIGDPEPDIGRALNFLIGPDSAFITGQTLLVNGGTLML
jgi:NAD(P)-dependent dehydrogenase (short-subunit alcohol dehydrogenase family)